MPTPTRTSVLGDPPDWLADSGKEMWQMLAEVLAESLKNLDRYALIMTCSSFAAAEAALQDLNERGPLVPGDRGMVKNPANQVAREQAASFRMWCTELGLTPAARKKLSLKVVKKDAAAKGLIT